MDKLKAAIQKWLPLLKMIDAVWPNKIEDMLIAFLEQLAGDPATLQQLSGKYAIVLANAG